MSSMFCMNTQHTHHFGTTPNTHTLIINSIISMVQVHLSVRIVYLQHFLNQHYITYKVSQRDPIEDHSLLVAQKCARKFKKRAIVRLFLNACLHPLLCLKGHKKTRNRENHPFWSQHNLTLDLFFLYYYWDPIVNFITCT